MTEFIGSLFVLPAVVICAIGYCLKKLAEENPEKAGEVKKQAVRKALQLAAKYRK